jgi:serine phosphatase RsbU (regulator of sigma subunit)
MSIQQHQFTQQVVGNYTCSYDIIPSRHSSYDAIDFFKISESKYGLYLIDVAGTGNLSIKAVAQVQELIIKLACSEQKTSFASNPESLIQQLNSTIYTIKLGKFLTLFYGVLDLENNCFNYSIAGHYPNPILLDNNNHAKYLFGKGFPLGILPNTTFEKFSIPISTNSSIILLSDGIMKFFMPQEDIEYRSNYLLTLICESNAQLPTLLQKLNLNSATLNILDDIIVAIIKRQN